MPPLLASSASSDVLARTLTLQRLRDDDVTWRLLSSPLAPVIVGILAVRLAGEERRIAAAELYELIDTDLDDLRAHGLELPLAAQGYCAAWREAGYLIRRPADEARGETFELSAGARRAIRILDEVATPRQAATESRLASIASALDRLANDTDPDATERLQRLHAERVRIDEQIERAMVGDIEVLDDHRALERFREIVGQASEIPGDFARVRAEFDELNRMLRQRVIESDASQRHVLDEVFRGVDLIDESESGQSFAAFSSLVLDPELGAAFDANVDRILDRDFAQTLPTEQRRFLRRLLSELKSDSAEVQQVVTSFARGLRRYVQSQDYRRDRVLRTLIRETFAAGLAAAPATKPYAATTLQLELSAVPLGSVGAVTLHHPDDVDARTDIEVNEPIEVDLELLRAITRETEIDFDELVTNVNLVLELRPQCTIADVLDRHPASQGVASIVGLMTLGEESGVRGGPGDLETVAWLADDAPRHARIPRYTFAGRVDR